MWNQHANTGLGMFAPFVALAFPVFEVALSVSGVSYETGRYSVPIEITFIIASCHWG